LKDDANLTGEEEAPSRTGEGEKAEGMTLERLNQDFHTASLSAIQNLSSGAPGGAWRRLPNDALKRDEIRMNRHRAL